MPTTMMSASSDIRRRQGARDRSANRPLAGLTVLVVEDSRVASEAVRLLCLRSGARLRRADCLASARRHLAAYRPSVAIVDMALPDGDGAALIEAFDAMQPRAPVVIGISGDPGRRQEALAAGAQGFLTKPIESVALFQQVILDALPMEERPKGLRLLPDDYVVPHDSALREDLLHAAGLLDAGAANTGTAEAGHGAPCIAHYLAGFLAGVARSARDAALEDAAETALAAPPMARSAAFAHLEAMVRKRIARLSDG